MFLVTGDIHREIDINRLNSSNFPFGKNLTKKDYLIITGDVGLIWDNSSSELWLRKWLEEKPWTTLFVDGNHENFDCLMEYPKTEWNDGLVSIISPSILWLRRGEVFNICGNKFFTMGGARSIDKHLRLPGKSWWPQEIPTNSDFENACKNLDKHKWEVDYVITHTCPYHEVDTFSPTETLFDKKFQDPTAMMLQEIKDKLNFKHWYFGHFHKFKSVGRFTCLYYEILTIS